MDYDDRRNSLAADEGARGMGADREKVKAHLFFRRPGTNASSTRGQRSLGQLGDNGIPGNEVAAFVEVKLPRDSGSSGRLSGLVRPVLNHQGKVSWPKRSCGFQRLVDELPQQEILAP